MLVSEFDFDLPQDRIALHPVEPRDAARMLIVRPGAPFADGRVRDLLEVLRPGDVLVINDTRVLPAELSGVRARGEHRAAVSFNLHKRVDSSTWLAFARPAKRLTAGDRVSFGQETDNACLLGTLDATVTEVEEGGQVKLRFDLAGPFLDESIKAFGAMPLPPYIGARRGVEERDKSDYQTVYARVEGAVAAPTAGLHFTEELLSSLPRPAASIERVTLHVGAGTFLPVKVEDTADHRMHAEWGEISEASVQRINAARAQGGRVVAVGTTSLRLLESAARATGELKAFCGETDIFITPGFRFRVVDVLMTNFHLPRSTLFMLVCAFAGMETMKAAYAHAIAAGYRFYSYGDASLLFPGGGAMTAEFSFTLLATDGAARRGRINLPRGEVRTPASCQSARRARSRPCIPSRCGRRGRISSSATPITSCCGRGRSGLRRWVGCMNSCIGRGRSSRIRVVSRSCRWRSLRKLTEEGVTFRSHIDGSSWEMSPERSIEIQLLLDSDIIMQLDECIPLPSPSEEMARDGTVAALGGAVQDRIRTPAGQGAFRHRAGRRRRRAARALGGGPQVHRLRRLRGRRPSGGRAAGDDVPRAVGSHAGAAGGQAALPHGGGQA
jgi:S-adenosylmethionine:tRNA ribosyltransferase-isomerase